MTRNYRSAYDQGFVRVAAATLRSHLADPKANVDEILRVARELSDEGVGVAVFPELCVSGYALDDLLLTDVLLEACQAELERLIEASRDLLPVLLVGAPIRWRHRVYNCAVVIHRGKALGVVPKLHPTNYREFYEKRHFASGAGVSGFVELNGEEVDFGADLLFHADDVEGLTIHAEICEDIWVAVPPSSIAALAGATICANLSASPVTVGRAAARHLMCKSASARNIAASIYAAAGPGESSTDLSWDGQTMIYEAGQLLAESRRFPTESTWCVADVDLDLLRQDRMRQGSFDDNARNLAAMGLKRGWTDIYFELDPPRNDIGLRRDLDRFPFVPDDPALLDQDCYEAFSIQVYGLKQRMAAIGDPKIVIGVSGGLDSTHALLVAARAMDEAGRPRSDILAFTMPGFATSDHTRNNAQELAEALGCTFETLDIRPTAELFLQTIGHAPDVYDVTYENVQAGLRTDYLFRIANQRGGIVLGTGDLSELALGWCTYGVGDQMSHYGVNTGVPKTLMQHLIRWVIASGKFDERVAKVLDSILNTEISPELVPTTGDEKPQSTEGTIGPYNLHDFFLFWTLRYGMRPSKIAFLAEHAWSDASHGDWPAGFPVDARPEYDRDEILKWLRVFGKRFYTQQFKRSALPNGPKVTAGGSLSPRGDWRMPSDANPNAWLAELDTLGQ